MQIAEYHKKITSLGSRDITVRVMTPDGYESGAKRYPVVYINDGQDVFRDCLLYTSAGPAPSCAGQP